MDKSIVRARAERLLQTIYLFIKKRWVWIAGGLTFLWLTYGLATPMDVADSEPVIARFTIVLAMATVWLAAGTICLWLVTRETLQHQQTSAQQELRAYVSVTDFWRNIIPDGEIRLAQIGPIIENTGATPSRGGLTRVFLHMDQARLSDAFEFSDTGSTASALITAGPRQKVQGPHVVIPYRDLEDQKRFTPPKYIYIYGWVEYDDVFNSPARDERWRTEFCYEVWGVWSAEGRLTDLAFRHHHRHNGADADCLRAASPQTRPSSPVRI